tara:strand:+ start:235 stop:540 length:306 start_codon:yes stop_codon:yes gene_type:complete
MVDFRAGVAIICVTSKDGSRVALLNNLRHRPCHIFFLKKGSTFIIGYKKAQVNRECASSQSGTRWVVLCFRVAIIRVTKEEGSSDVTARSIFDTDPAMNYY